MTTTIGGERRPPDTTTHYVFPDVAANVLQPWHTARAACGRLIRLMDHVLEPTCPDCARRIAEYERLDV